MFAKLHSLGLTALDGLVVTVEADICGGLPQLAIVGLPDSAVKEAGDRVRSALKNLGYTYPVSRITVNLAPADIKKTGPVYDLPLLMGLLAASGQIPPPPPDCAFIGELGLNGNVRAVSGVLPMALACPQGGIKRLFLPSENMREAVCVKDLTVYPVDSAAQVVSHLAGSQLIQPAPPAAFDFTPGRGAPDFADVRGQPEARRAMEIAAVGMHNLVMIGSPGAGKSMLAKRLAGILPPMGREEAIETSKIYSVAGLLRKKGRDNLLITTRPLRAPHQSVSAAGLAGGTAQLRPGEISLAHNGVLFLDELPEYKRDALEVLRQPLEDGTVTVSRVSGTVTYPSRFMLVAAMNPCPCGYFGHPARECRCLPAAMDRYLQRISGPLLDRIDLHIEVRPVDYDEISAGQPGESSAAVAARVTAARNFALQTRRAGGPFPLNAHLTAGALRGACPLSDDAKGVMRRAFEQMGLSARGHDRVLRVCRSIADLDASETVQSRHVLEAVQYRNLDRKYWYTK